MAKWTKKEIEILKEKYSQVGKCACMKLLNRSDSSIRQKTSRLGLKQDRNSLFFEDWQKRAAQSKIGKKRPEQALVMRRTMKREWADPNSKVNSEEHRIDLLKRLSDWYKTHKHPRGMLGKTHLDEVKKILSENLRKAWQDPNNYLNSEEYRQLLSNRQTKRMNNRIKNKGSVYSRTNNGWYKVEGVKSALYFRSSWEVVYARYLQWMKNRGMIKKWEYEKDTFWFKKIKRGVRSYTPDFKVFNNTGTIEYHEVKGWMDKKSKTKLGRIKKYYPEITLVLIDKYIYKDIEKLERMFPGAKKLPKN